MSCRRSGDDADRSRVLRAECVCVCVCVCVSVNVLFVFLFDPNK